MDWWQIELNVNNGEYINKYEASNDIPLKKIILEYINIAIKGKKPTANATFIIESTIVLLITTK